MATRQKNKTIRKNKQRDAGDHVKREKLVGVLFKLCVTAFIILTVYVLFFSSLTEVRDVTISGYDRVGVAQVTRIVEGILNERKRWGVPQRYFFALSESDIRQELRSHFAEIREVVVHKQFPDAIEVVIEEYSELVVACGDSDDGRRVCVHIGTDGTAGEVADFTGSLLQSNPFVQIDISDTIPTGEGAQILAPEIQENALTVYRELPFETSIRPIGSLQFLQGVTHARIQTDEGWSVIFDASVNPNISMEVLALFLREQGGVVQRDTLQEVDIRILDKIFYRVKKEGEQTTNASNENSI